MKIDHQPESQLAVPVQAVTIAGLPALSFSDRALSEILPKIKKPSQQVPEAQKEKKLTKVGARTQASHRDPGGCDAWPPFRENSYPCIVACPARAALVVSNTAASAQRHACEGDAVGRQGWRAEQGMSLSIIHQAAVLKRLQHFDRN